MWDVLAGSVLGSSMAYFSYRRYFPGPWSRGAGEPYELLYGDEVRRIGRWREADEETAISEAGAFELDEIDEGKGGNHNDGADRERRSESDEMRPLNDPHKTGIGS